MENYKLHKDPLTNQIFQYASRLSDGALVHTEKNKEYLEWLEEGNTPQPPD